MKQRLTFPIPFFPARTLTLLFVLLSLVPSAQAQEPSPTPSQVQQPAPSSAEVQAEVLATLKLLQQQIAELQKRTKELEARLNQPTPSPTASTQAALAVEPVKTETLAKAEVVAKEEPEVNPVMDHSGHGGGGTFGGGVLGIPGMQIRGFGDVTFRTSDIKGQTSTFALSQLNLFVTSRLTDKMNVLSEIGIEMQQDNSIGLDLERVLLQYAVSDYFNLNVGRYHTAIGYYNTAFHHGTWFQTAIGRPFLFTFEDAGGILPIHNVGISVNGRVPSGKLGLSYVAELGNGRTSRNRQLRPVQNTVDENNGKAFNFGLISRPRWVPGLQMGFSVYRDRLTPERLPKIDQTIWAAHVVYQTPSFEFLNEAAVVRHTPVNTNQTINLPGFYTQISQRLFNKVRPYFRYEYLNVPARDLIYGDIGRRNGPTLGVRYELGEFTAFKLQYARSARHGQDPSNTLRMQMAFTF